MIIAAFKNGTNKAYKREEIDLILKNGDVVHIYEPETAKIIYYRNERGEMCRV